MRGKKKRWVRRQQKTGEEDRGEERREKGKEMESCLWLALAHLCTDWDGKPQVLGETWDGGVTKEAK